MKYQKYLLLIFLFVSPNILSAQLSIGIKGGVTRAWEEYGEVGLPDDAEIHINGLNFSGMVYYQLNDFLKIGIEPGFVQRGAACEPGFDNFNGTAELHVNYFEMPVVLASQFSLISDNIQLLAKAGLDNSISTTAFRMENIGSANPTRTDLDIGDGGVSRFDPSLQGALGLGYQLGRHLLFVETQYDFGLTDVVSTARSENRSASLSLGYMVNI